ncbi:hypothetical protein BCR44DRAFT_1261913 [Catenaria anguillulae PL171]|uniref:Uncharacterized protein n=1 Tax=Catenaria anguillulae PL171 TaxID=765915 RepID=A0A1Y2HF63_9FUNG|nr:hypothetical protein BCR44DRAFT_1261913 [Catenaria anguillulae PL171]
MLRRNAPSAAGGTASGLSRTSSGGVRAFKTPAKASKPKAHPDSPDNVELTESSSTNHGDMEGRPSQSQASPDPSLGPLPTPSSSSPQVPRSHVPELAASVPQHPPLSRLSRPSAFAQHLPRLHLRPHLPHQRTMLCYGAGAQTKSTSPGTETGTWSSARHVHSRMQTVESTFFGWYMLRLVHIV